MVKLSTVEPMVVILECTRTSLWTRVLFISLRIITELLSHWMRERAFILTSMYSSIIKAAAFKCISRWAEVLYQLNKIIKKASLYENYAIRRLQEQFILNIAAEVIMEETIKYMELEIEEIDQQERIENPPREILM